MVNPPKRSRTSRDISGWRVCPASHEVYPSEEYLSRFCRAYAEYSQNDNLVLFKFPAHFSAPDAVVHESRLAWVGGPLAAMLTTGFQEAAERKVLLSEEDDPRTFAVIRDFLYGKRIDLTHIGLTQLQSVIRSSHRWALLDLFEVACRYICVRELLQNATNVLNCVDAASLPGVPHDFKDYFWSCAGLYFDGFSPNDRNIPDDDGDDADDDWSLDEEDEVELEEIMEDFIAEQDSDNEEEEEEENNSATDRIPVLTVRTGWNLCNDTAQNRRNSTDRNESLGAQLPSIEKRLAPFFPDIWELAVSHGVITTLIRDILRTSSRNMNTLKADLMQLVLQYLEPKIEADEVVTALMTLVFSDFMRNAHYIDRREFQEGCSIRGMRLFSKALIASARRPRAEMTYGWRVLPPREGTIVRASYDFTYGMTGGCEPDGTMFVRGIEARNQSLYFNIRIKSHPHGAVEFQVKWESGRSFAFASKDLMLRVSLIDDECNCNAARGASGKYLFDRSMQESVIGRDTRFTGAASTEAMRRYFRDHGGLESGDRDPCTPTLWLQVKLVDS